MFKRHPVTDQHELADESAGSLRAAANPQQAVRGVYIGNDLIAVAEVGGFQFAAAMMRMSAAVRPVALPVGPT